MTAKEIYDGIAHKLNGDLVLAGKITDKAYQSASARIDAIATSGDVDSDKAIAYDRLAKWAKEGDWSEEWCVGDIGMDRYNDDFVLETVRPLIIRAEAAYIIASPSL